VVTFQVLPEVDILRAHKGLAQR